MTDDTRAAPTPEASEPEPRCPKCGWKCATMPNGGWYCPNPNCLQGPVPAREASSAPGEPFDLDREINALVNATRDIGEGAGELSRYAAEEAQDAIYAEFARLRATVAALTADRTELLAHLTAAKEALTDSHAARDDVEARLRDAERDRDALREVVQDFAIVGRHTETWAHGSSDQYRMPTGASWFDTPAAAVTDYLAARATPRGAP